jgi:multisubunit Na+/H+ antiporter MnhG subunit
MSETQINYFTKVTSLGFGILAIGVAFLAGSVEGVLQFCVTVTSTFAAPILSLFITSVTLPFVNKQVNRTGELSLKNSDI